MNNLKSLLIALGLGIGLGMLVMALITNTFTGDGNVAIAMEEENIAANQAIIDTLLDAVNREREEVKRLESRLDSQRELYKWYTDDMKVRMEKPAMRVEDINGDDNISKFNNIMDELDSLYIGN